jgi:hypothetical protein
LRVVVEIDVAIEIGIVIAIDVVIDVVIELTGTIRKMNFTTIVKTDGWACR